MKTRILPILASAVLCIGSAMSAQAADYCHAGNLTRTSGDRGLDSFSLTDGTTTVNVQVGQGKSYGSATYFDKTSSVLTVEPGATISFATLAWNGSWMHGFVYVDYNNDGTFNTTLNANGSGTGELVAYSFYSPTHGSQSTNSAGESVANGVALNVTTMPSFTVPGNLASGDYRLRFKVDWDDLNPCGATVEKDGGSITDITLRVLSPRPMQVESVGSELRSGKVAAGRKNLALAVVSVETDGTLEPLHVKSLDMQWLGGDVVENLRWEHSATSTSRGTKVADVDVKAGAQSVAMDCELFNRSNKLILVGDVKDNAPIDSKLSLTLSAITIGDKVTALNPAASEGYVVSDIIDYTLGNALWFDTPNSSTAGVAVWNTNDFSSTDVNPDQIWERKSFPIGNGSFGGNVLGSVNRERVVLNEKTLWKGGPGTGAAAYWNMNKTVSESTLSSIRQYLASGSNSYAHSLVSSNYRGNLNYDRSKFGTYTMMGEAYVSTGIADNAVTDYKRIMNIDRSLVVVEFNSGETSYQRRYFCSYPDSVMVWRFTSDGEPQNLTFSFVSPQTINAVTSPADGSLLYDGQIPSNNGMKWALRVDARVNDGGKVVANASARTITVTGSNDVEFILAGDTDYIMNFDPDFSDPATYVGVDPVASVNAMVEKAAAKGYEELYDNHYADYSELYDRVDLAINPSETFENLPTPTRLARYRAGTLDHGLEQQYFNYGRYLLISSSRAGNMPANLQGMWHNNTDGPWRVDYHNNINLQMNYWPATCTNLLECFTPFIDYVRGLIKPGEQTAKSYYNARGWTAEVSTNIFGHTAPLNSGEMLWNYNPTAGPWLATQIWEYYDYTRDKEWLREVGYPIIKSSANFVSDLLYLHNGTYTSAPSYSPEHGTCDLGATYANAVTREVLQEAISAAEVLGENPSELSEWKDKLDKMYPYQVGRYGQLQEWYKDIDTYNDDHRHTNHLFGLHPGTTINALKDQKLVDACKETLRQRGDAATGWSMGWKLNHWARLLDGNHAYILFQNLLKNGTADNMWDLHPPFQIDGNFGGSAGVSELFLQSHNGMLHLLPALPDEWTDGHIRGLRTRGNFTVDINYAGGKLDYADVVSNAGEPCKVYYNGKETSFETVEGGRYRVRYNDAEGTLKIDDLSGVASIADDATTVRVAQDGNQLIIDVDGAGIGTLDIELYTISGQLIKTASVIKGGRTATATFGAPAGKGVYLLHVNGADVDATSKVVVR